MRKRLQQVALFFDAAHSTSSEVIDFDEFMSSTSGHSTPTMMYWMKKTTNAIYDTGRKESVQVALLQTHESSQVDWKRKTNCHYNLIPHLENLQKHSYNSSVLAFAAIGK